MRGPKVLAALAAVAMLSGCLNNSAPAEVGEFVDGAGAVVGAAEPCAPRLAARATACARHVVATWPGGLGHSARLAALQRLDAVRGQAATARRSCPAAVDALRRSSVWENCYSRPTS